MSTIARRQFMRASVGYIGLAAEMVLPKRSAASGNNQDSATVTRPNIVLIVSDDTGWADVGFHGSEIKTPHLDRLIRDGKELNRFYVEPVCSPTRASLMIGRPSSRVGIQTPLQTYSENGLPRDTVSVAEHLRRTGYDTCISVKWHLGMQPEYYPAHYGFRHSYGYVGPWIDSYTHLTTNFREHDEPVCQWHRNGELIDEQGTHVTDLIANEAIRFITSLRNPTKPFFLYVPFSAPHVPIQEDSRWLEPYRNTIDNTSRRYFAGAMTHMDDAIGRIVGTLERVSLKDNTIVIFSSDNGGQRGGEYRQKWMKPPARYYMSYGETDVLGNNEPLRGWKGQLYEGGIRVPALVYWPGKLSSGIVDEVLSVQDIYPTLAHIAGTQIPADSDIEGMNVWQALQGESLPDDRVIYVRLGPRFAILKKGWKLIHLGKNPDEGTNELFHLDTDPYEKTDLSNQNPHKLAELKEELKLQYAQDM